jgi:thiol-disulfide isomerase/thioredoxin
MLLRFVLASFVIVSALGCATAPPRLAHPETDLPELDAKSGQITVIAFFATWCPVSQEMLKVAQELWARDRYNGLRVIAVHEDEPTEFVDHYLTQHHVDLDVARDRESAFARTLGIRTIPALVVIDGDGGVRRVVNGYHGDDDKRAAEGAVAQLFREMNAAAARRRAAQLQATEAETTLDETPPDSDDGKSEPESESM